MSVAHAGIITKLRVLAGLVNNAGMVVVVPMECTPLDQLRLQLEVNVVGVVAVTRAFMPPPEIV